MTESSYKQFLSKPEISFWVPILTSVVLITVSWFTLSTNVALLNQKVDNLTALVETLTTKYSSVEDRYGKLSLKVQRLETIDGIEN